MHELGISLTRRLIELLLAQASPSVAKPDSEFERPWGGAHGLDLPEASLILRDHELELALQIELLLDLENEVLPRCEPVHEHELAALMELFSAIERLANNVVGWQVDQDDAAEDPKEFLLSNLHGLFELYVLRFGARGVPFGVHASDARAQASRDVVFHLSGLADAIVQGVHFKDELLVDFLVHLLQPRVVESDAPVVQDGVGDDLFAEVSVDEPGAAQLGNVLRRVCPRLLERDLVVIKSISLGIIDASHVHNNIKLVEDVIIARPHNNRISKLARLQEHRRGEHFVAMERL